MNFIKSFIKIKGSMYSLKGFKEMVYKQIFSLWGFRFLSHLETELINSIIDKLSIGQSGLIADIIDDNLAHVIHKVATELLPKQQINLTGFRNLSGFGLYK